MSVLLSGKDSQDIIILMDGLAEVATVLLIPPVAMGVAKLALFLGRIDVAAVLEGKLIN